MRLQQKIVEFGLKNYFELKFENKELDYTNIPELIEAIEVLNRWLNVEEKNEKTEFSFSEIEWLELLLNKYFRNDFIKFIDTKSIQEYLGEKETYGLEGTIFGELLFLKDENKESSLKEWLLTTKKKIDFSKKYNRSVPTGKILNGISFDEYNNQEIRRFLREYFINELGSIFAEIHLIKALGLYKYQKNKEHIQPIKTKADIESPQKFEELFYNSDDAKVYLSILNEIEPPLINEDFGYIGKSKGAICIWIDEMERQNIIKKITDRKIFSKLIPTKINNFSIDESMFGKYHKRAEKNYRLTMKTHISSKKLSQFSQSGKMGK